ncbi:MAG: hypothetical protein O2925_04020 [Actinomycetota bacterium]|nr:hypothetical protein [Actinomycetota bacterium]MDA3015863.1 hypothetical protein [Actinomycetota bacterium]MDA3027943.1 hypothetical protein [Actinomycetota bacterium]
MHPDIQYRLVIGKGDERVSGSDAAAVVVTVPLSVVAADGFDPTAEYMRGRLKAAGHTGVLFAALADGSACTELVRLASDL